MFKFFTSICEQGLAKKMRKLSSTKVKGIADKVYMKIIDDIWRVANTGKTYLDIGNQYEVCLIDGDGTPSPMGDIIVERLKSDGFRCFTTIRTHSIQVRW